jgi:hypothetical protein
LKGGGDAPSIKGLFSFVRPGLASISSRGNGCVEPSEIASNDKRHPFSPRECIPEEHLPHVHVRFCIPEHWGSSLATCSPLESWTVLKVHRLQVQSRSVCRVATCRRMLVCEHHNSNELSRDGQLSRPVLEASCPSPPSLAGRGLRPALRGVRKPVLAWVDGPCG